MLAMQIPIVQWGSKYRPIKLWFVNDTDSSVRSSNCQAWGEDTPDVSLGIVNFHRLQMTGNKVEKVSGTTVGIQIPDTQKAEHTWKMGFLVSVIQIQLLKTRLFNMVCGF